MRQFVFCLLWVSWQVIMTDAASFCTMSYLTDCMQSFQTYYDEGVRILQSADNTTAVLICRKYETASACIGPALHRCPDLKKLMKEKMNSFDYACSHMYTERSENWPFMPTLPPDTVDRDLNTVTESSDKDDLRSTAIKAGVAAGVTVLLISVCIFAECVSRYRVWKRVKKATAATATQCETPILTKEEEAQIDEPKKI